MNAHDIIHYGDKTLRTTLEGLSDAEWETVGATSEWTPKDVLAHLTSYELLLGDVLDHALNNNASTPNLSAYQRDEAAFSKENVEKRKEMTREKVLNEYTTAHARVVALLQGLSSELLRTPGTIPWYGKEYSLDDFIVYNNYAHKREHSGMIRLFLKNLRRTGG